MNWMRCGKHELEEIWEGWTKRRCGKDELEKMRET
jgi:hypothetical protein